MSHFSGLMARDWAIMRDTAAKDISHRNPCISTLVFGIVQVLIKTTSFALTARDLSLEMLYLLLTSLPWGLAIELKWSFSLAAIFDVGGCETIALTVAIPAQLPPGETVTSAFVSLTLKPQPGRRPARQIKEIWVKHIEVSIEGRRLHDGGCFS